MIGMTLYGTTTSPFVRRVRVVAAELGVSYRLVDTNAEAGQAALRERSPIWKVPTVELDGQVIWDSGNIVDALVSRHGYGPLRGPPDVAERNFISAVDEGLLALVRAFYLKKDGIEASQASYLQKEQKRADAVFAWVASRLRGPFVTDERAFGLGELALVTALDWMTFRAVWNVAAHPAFTTFLAAHADRPSIAATPPVA